jgi:hypothetical protein
LGLTAAKRLYSLPEATSVEKLNQGDRIATARATSSTVEDLLFAAHRESVGSATDRTRAFEVASPPAKLHPASGKLGLD